MPGVPSRVWQQKQKGKGAGDPVVSLSRECCFPPSLLTHLPCATQGISQGTGLRRFTFTLLCLAPVGFPPAPVALSVPSQCLPLLGFVLPKHREKGPRHRWKP